MNKVKEDNCARIIHVAAASAAAVGGGMAQTPGGDSAAIMPIQAAMIAAIAREFGRCVTLETAASMITPFAATYVGRGVSQFLVGWIPGIGNAINAATAAGITEAIGWGAVELFCTEEDKVPALNA